MSLLTTALEFFSGLSADSIALVLIVKWTAVLALAWLAHGVFVGRNPRWRVALWRSAIVGLAMVAVLSAAPPIVTYQSVSRDSPSVPAAPSLATAQAALGQGTVATILERQPGSPVHPETVVGSSDCLTIRRDEPLARPRPMPIASNGDLGWPRGCGRSGWPASSYLTVRPTSRQAWA